MDYFTFWMFIGFVLAAYSVVAKNSAKLKEVSE